MTDNIRFETAPRQKATQLVGRDSHLGAWAAQPIPANLVKRNQGDSLSDDGDALQKRSDIDRRTEVSAVGHSPDSVCPLF